MFYSHWYFILFHSFIFKEYQLRLIWRMCSLTWSYNCFYGVSVEAEADIYFVGSNNGAQLNLVELVVIEKVSKRLTLGGLLLILGTLALRPRWVCSWSNSRSSSRCVSASFCWMAMRRREFSVFFSSSAAASCLCISSSWVTYSSHLYTERQREDTSFIWGLNLALGWDGLMFSFFV